MDRPNTILVLSCSISKVISCLWNNCPSSISFRKTFTFPGDSDTYANCDWFTTDNIYRVGTSCIDNTAYFTQWIEDGSSTSATLACDGDCVAVRLYDNPDDLEGLRWLVSCDDSIGVSTSISTLFSEDPTEWDTATESTTTTSESSTTVTDSASSTESETSPSVTFPSRTSKPEETESPTDRGTKDGDGPSGGVIAGAVVGSIAGAALIVGIIILAFRMGRRSRGDTEGPSGFRDSMRSIPTPTMTSHQPEPKPPVPVIQPVFVQDSQPYHSNN
ncbi:hypothetical protein FCIRC_3372 [Fusarium circinatum]|uniref:Uncharacterized protein n=1 Tax=Fusarium circinatum TaxID=48490 RepID=A0A8H5UAC0_FUSCI|nr:hypothetical protein FCIRC_3372 [Fusarium circinatum]